MKTLHKENCQKTCVIQKYSLLLYRNKIYLMLFSNKKGISLSMMEEILGFDKVEQTFSSTKKEILKQEEIGITIFSNSNEILALFDELQIPYKENTIEEVLKFLFDRLLYEYMEDQSYYTEESYNRFKNTFIYMQLQMLIYHTKSLMLWLYNDIEQIPISSKRLYRKKDINPVYETNYLEKYENFKMIMDVVKPERLVDYFNSLVGLKHFSVRTKAIYHAFVEELEIRDINYDCMLYSKERMLSYKIEINLINNELVVTKSTIKSA